MNSFIPIVTIFFSYSVAIICIELHTHSDASYYSFLKTLVSLIPLFCGYFFGCLIKKIFYVPGTINKTFLNSLPLFCFLVVGAYFFSNDQIFNGLYVSSSTFFSLEFLSSQARFVMLVVTFTMMLIYLPVAIIDSLLNLVLTNVGYEYIEMRGSIAILAFVGIIHSVSYLL
jgi:hypothetical protein